MASADLSALDASLKHRKAKATKLLVKQMTNGWGELEKFTKLKVLDEIVLGSLAFKSVLQPGAKGAFNPKADIVKAQARIGKVRPAKVDLLITEQERLQLEATYFAEVEGTPGRDPENFWLADHIYEGVIESAGVDTLKAVWKGVLNSAGTNPVDVCDGLITLVDKDIVSGELPASLVLTHSVANFYITQDNVIDEFKKQVKLYRSQLPAYGYKPSTLYCAPERLSEYEFALEASNGRNLNTYNSFNQQVLYFAPNIRIVPVIDYAGTDTILIVPDGNLLYLTDRDQGRTELDSDYNKRDRSIAIVGDFWFAPNYLRADIMTVNDLRARPVAAGV